MRFLFIGDVVGEAGIRALESGLEQLHQEGQKFDFVIANVENAAGGYGVDHKTMARLAPLGINCLTSGNHIWDRPEAEQLLQTYPNLLRPANYPIANPGTGMLSLRLPNGSEAVVINLQGRVFMEAIDCPFQVVDRLLEEVGEDKIIIVDFHAEASSEKQAMAWYLDGRATAVIGTHTHVQTADARILPRGTGFITDVGMSGPYDSVIGMEIADSLRRFACGHATRLRAAQGNPRFAAVIIDVDPLTCRCTSIAGLMRDVSTCEVERE